MINIYKGVTLAARTENAALASSQKRPFNFVNQTFGTRKRRIFLAIFAASMGLAFLQPAQAQEYRRKRIQRKLEKIERKNAPRPEIAPAPVERGVIKGKIYDDLSGEPLVGVALQVSGGPEGFKPVGLFCDYEGGYQFSNLPDGIYEVKAELSGYSPMLIKDIEIKGGKGRVLDLSMKEPETVALESVVIVGALNQASDAALLAVQRKSLQISDSYSGEMVLRETPDFQATTVLRRMPGVALVEEKALSVRGLYERYNNFTLNGALIPFYDLDRVGFDYSIIQSNLITSFRMIKSATADHISEFGGGLMDVQTADIPSEDQLRVTVQGIYNDKATFQEFYTEKGNQRAALFFKEPKNLPAGLPDAPTLAGIPSTDPRRFDAAQKMASQYYYDTLTAAPPGHNINLGFQKRYQLRDGYVAGFTAYVNYLDNYKYSRDSVTVLGPYSDSLQKCWDNNPAGFTNNTHSRNLTVMFNTGLQLKNNGKLSFRNIFIYNGENAAIPSTGVVQDINRNIANRYYYDIMRFVGSQLYAGQLHGEHQMYQSPRGKAALFEWQLNYSRLAVNEPGYKGALYLQNTSGVSNFEDGRYYYLSTHDDYTSRFAATQINHMTGGQIKFTLPMGFHTISAGVFVNVHTTEFRSRRFSIAADDASTSSFNLNPEILVHNYAGDMFAAQNFGPIGFNVYEFTKDYQNYNTRRTNVAPFLMGAFRFSEKWMLNLGVRLEYYNRYMEVFPVSKPVLNDTLSFKGNILDHTEIDPLPSGSLIFSASEKINLRAAYARTLSRPTNREMTPITYLDFFTSVKTSGGVLNRVDIHNAEFKFEYFPSGRELISFCVFTKLFNNPIEQIMDGNAFSGPTTSQVYISRTSNQAIVAGMEFEFRRNLGLWFNLPYLESLTLYGNLALMRSHTQSFNLFEKGRPLQGQAPYLVNLGLIFAEPKTHISLAAFYNRVGSRIALVGAGPKLFPDIWEQPRDVVDIQLSRAFGKHFEVRFAIPDLLNQPLRLVSINDERSSYIEGSDPVARKYQRGRSFYFTLTYKLR